MQLIYGNGLDICELVKVCIDANLGSDERRKTASIAFSPSFLVFNGYTLISWGLATEIQISFLGFNVSFQCKVLFE